MRIKPKEEQLDIVKDVLGIVLPVDADKLKPFKDAVAKVSSLQTQLTQATQAQTALETKLGAKLNELDAKLGGKTLNDIPAGKTLKDLIENPNAPDSAALQAQIDQLNSQLTNKEKEVVKSIHDELQLGLASGEIDKAQVLAEIKKLIANKRGGGSDEDKAKITKLENDIADLKSQKDTIVREVVVEKIIEKEAEKNYGVAFTSQEIARIQAAPNAQEALNITNSIVKEKVEGLKGSRKNSYMLN